MTYLKNNSANIFQKCGQNSKKCKRTDEAILMVIWEALVHRINAVDFHTKELPLKWKICFFLQMFAVSVRCEAVMIRFETKTPRLSRTWWATSERTFQNRCRPDNAKVSSTKYKHMRKPAHTHTCTHTMCMHKHLPPKTSKQIRNAHLNSSLSRSLESLIFPPYSC